MKSERTIMEILEAFDLVGTYSGAARLAGCAPNTVKRHVLAQERGENVPVGRKRRVGIVDVYRPKIEELVEQSQGRIEARVEQACALALASRVRSPRYAHLKLILETRQDETGRRHPRFETPTESVDIDAAGYVRGAEYYAGGAR